jgi:signal transduction histidine kinase
MNGAIAHHAAAATDLGAFAATIAHEITQPLTGVILNTRVCMRLLEAESADIEAARETVRLALRAAERASNVITQVRTLFGHDLGTHELLDLNEVTREAIALSLEPLRKYRVSLRTQLAKDPPVIHGCRVQLQQVILNLLLNAAQAMSGIDDRIRRLIVSTEQAGQDVRLSIADVGVGFDPERASSLFEAFYTTKPGGMGIGLSVSRSIVEHHGGRMSAALNEGPGATFSFSIPLTSKRKSNCEASRPRSNTPRNGRGTYRANKLAQLSVLARPQSVFARPTKSRSRQRHL